MSRSGKTQDRSNTERNLVPQVDILYIHHGFHRRKPFAICNQTVGSVYQNLKLLDGTTETVGMQIYDL
ncbi:hypothetical protein ACJX0J_015444, partial [Zea mays]